MGSGGEPDVRGLEKTSRFRLGTLHVVGDMMIPLVYPPLIGSAVCFLFENPTHGAVLNLYWNILQKLGNS